MCVSREPKVHIGNGIYFMFTLGTPYQVKYSDCLHLVFKPINDNVLVLIHLYCNVLILIYNPKSEKVGTVWKTQIKKESSDF